MVNGNGREIISPYTNLHGKAGDEVSSTFEGRHILMPEEWLVHPMHNMGLDLVRKGDPVAFWDGVGIALKTAQSVDEAVPIDTEGIWRLSVTNTGANWWGDIIIGQTLFISGTGVVHDDWTAAFAIFGYALEFIPAPNGDPVTAVIAVKVHWMYPYWYYDVENGGPL